jgi:nucleoside-diphosphate-sugar epimerase
MKVLVTGSAGHLGEALVRTLQNASHEVVGLDIVASHFTTKVGSIADRSHVTRCMKGVDAVRHNVKANEYLYRRVDLEDVVSAHLLALERAPSIGFGRYIITATTPFLPDDLFDLRANAPLVVRGRVPEYEVEYARRGWKMFPSIDRVYINEKARRDLHWKPRYNFEYVLRRLRSNEEFRSALSITVGSKRYHTEKFVGGP